MMFAPRVPRRLHASGDHRIEPGGAEARRAAVRRPSRKRRLGKVGAWLVGIAVAVFVLNLLGVDILGWLSDLWDQIKATLRLPRRRLGFQIRQTTLTALAWYYGILRAAYPRQVEPTWQIVAAYAAGVAMNGFLPANIGTFVMLLMFVAHDPGRDVRGLARRLWSCRRSSSRSPAPSSTSTSSSPSRARLENLGNLPQTPGRSRLIAGGAFLLIVARADVLGRQVKGLWEQAKQGGAILARPTEYLTRAFLPSFVAWLCEARRDRGLPGRVRDPGHVPHGHVRDRRELARQRRVGDARRGRDHPGDQRRSRSTRAATSTGTAVDYSASSSPSRPRGTSSFAVVVVVWSFGWTGGKLLVSSSYADAKVKVAEQKAQRAAKKEAKRAEDVG